MRGSRVRLLGLSGNGVGESEDEEERENPRGGGSFKWPVQVNRFAEPGRSGSTGLVWFL